METRKLLAVLMLVIVLSMTALVWFFPPTGDFGAENPFWNGLSTFNSEFDATPINAYGDYPARISGTAIIVVPYVQFTPQELESLHTYISEGGTLIIIDDFGYGNQILSKLGLNMKFSNSPLMDPLFNYKNKWLPRITDFTESAYTANLSSIVFNHASSLSNTEDVSVLAYSSKFSFIDQNGNGVWEESESTGPVPVAAYASVGQGVVVAVSDPSLIINGMINMEDNAAFARSIIELQGSGPQVYVDQMHLPKTALDDAKAAIATVYLAVSSPLGTLSLIAVVFALSLNSLWRKGGKLGTKRS